VTAGGLVFAAGGGRTLYALDTRTGTVLWEHPLEGIGYSNPMTWRGTDGVQRVALATGTGSSARLVVFSLP
jgi:quinoprotein glucose dehydrogenase